MKKNLARTFLFLVGISVVTYFVIMFYMSYQMSAISNKTWKVMESNKFECPTGMEVKMEGWSKVGYSRTCISLRNGKWEAWDDGYKHIDGYYEQGKKQGKWVYYKPDGTVSKEVEYNQDVEVTGNELPQKNR